MEPDHPNVSQTDDSSIRDNTGPVIVLKNEYPKESPWRQPAIYVAILALILTVGGEWRRWVALDDMKVKQHDYYEEINVWETDAFNRTKDIDAYLRANIGVDTVKLFGKPKAPPVPKGY